ncbi:MAG: phosphatase PAP2 family protein [Halobacteriota archaeon]
MGALVAIGLATMVGYARLRGLQADWLDRTLSVLPEFGLLGVILLVNSVAREFGPDVSWVIGFEVTDLIYQLEGDLIVWIQSFANSPVTAYFSRMYVYGYTFLLIFPLVAYLALEDNRPLRTLIVAYAGNYLIGLFFYLVIIAYGPRNLLPDTVEPLLYSTYPEYQTLTRQVNRNTNVFPSLHASLSATVVLLAVRTREAYPRWLPISTGIALSVIVSTMYLGIHWATDVVAGIVLAVLAVHLADRVVEYRGQRTPFADRILERYARD